MIAIAVSSIVLTQSFIRFSFSAYRKFPIEYVCWKLLDNFDVCFIIFLETIERIDQNKGKASIVNSFNENVPETNIPNPVQS